MSLTGSLHARLSVLTSVGAIAVLCLALFAPWWRQGQVCAPLDIVRNLYEPWAQADRPVQVHNHYPTDNVDHYLLYRQTAHRSWREEGQFGWNPLKSGGTAEYANTMATPFDWTYVLHRFLPFWQAWNLGLLCQYGLAMVGMLVLLRTQGYRTSLCLVGALAYGLNGHFAAWMYHRWALGSFCWTPWFLASLDALLRGKRCGLAAPLWLTLAFLGGHLQYAAFQVIVAACFTLGWWWDRCPRTLHGALRPFGTVAVTGAVGVLLAGMMFVPCAYAFQVTMQYGLVRGGLGYPEGLTGALRNLLAYPTFIFPVPLGSPSTFDAYKLFASDLMQVPFFGSLLVVLAFVGIGLKQVNTPAKILAVAGLALPLTPLLGPLYQRLLLLFALGGIWLAIDLLDRLDDQRFALWSRRFGYLFLIGTAALLALSVAVTVYRSELIAVLQQMAKPQIAAHQFGARPDWFGERIHRYVAQLPIWAPRVGWSWILFGASILLLPLRKHRLFGAGLAALITLQLWGPHREWMVFCDPEANPNRMYPETVETDAIRRIVGPDGRVLVLQSRGRLPLFPPNGITDFGVASIVAYDSILPNGMQKGVPYRPSMAQLPSADVLGAKGVTHLVAFADSPAPDGPWDRVATAGKVAVYSNRLARARYVANTPSEAVPIVPGVRTRNRRVLDVPAGATTLSICENWGEGWRFRVNDGSWCEMRRADDKSMVADIPLSASPQRVEMQYAPRARRVGLAVSAVGLLMYALAAVWWWRCRKWTPMHANSMRASR